MKSDIRLLLSAIIGLLLTAGCQPETRQVQSAEQPARHDPLNQGFVGFGRYESTPAVNLARFADGTNLLSDGEPPTIDSSKASAITNGITLGQMVKILGPGGEYSDYNSGIFIVRWNFTDGRQLVVHPFNDTESEVLNKQGWLGHFSFSTYMSVESFKFIGKETTMQQVIAKLGKPDLVAYGSPDVYVYCLSDGTEVNIGHYDEHIVFVTHDGDTLFKNTSFIPKF